LGGREIEMKKNLLVWLILTVFIFSISGCSLFTKKGSQQEAVSFKAAVLRGPTAVGMIKMMDSQPSLGDNVKAEYVIEQTPDTLNSKLLTGEIEFATIPTNMAATLYNKGVGYQIAAMNTWGVMYVLTNGADIKSWADLKGKEVDSSSKGSAADVVFRYLLSKNGVDPDKDITLKYTASPVEQAQLAIAGKSKVTVLPEPWVSTVLAKNQNMKLALDLQKEWTRINGADVPFAQTCLVVKSDFASKYPEITANFLQEYANSINWVNSNPSKAGELIKNHDIGIPADVAAASIPRCNLRYMSSTDAKPAVEKYLQVLFNFSPASIGGKLPDAKFYYQK
jgi:NitT/TauT family transport system substrate-binding protein